MQFSHKICICFTLFMLTATNSFAGTTVSSKGSSSSRGSGFSSSKSSTSSRPSSVVKAPSKSQFGQFSQQSTTRQTNRSSVFSQDLSRNASQERARQAMQAREQAARQAELAKRNAAERNSPYSQSNQWGNQNGRQPNYQNRGQPNYNQNAPVVVRENRSSDAGAIVTGMVLGSIFSHQNGHAEPKPNRESSHQSNTGLEPIDNPSDGVEGTQDSDVRSGATVPEPPFNPNAVAQDHKENPVTYSRPEESGSSFITWLVLFLTVGALYAFYRIRTQRRQTTTQYHLGGN